jgi:hypothetical protein
MASDFDRIRETIRRLIDGTLKTYEWDDNMQASKSKDSRAEALRRIALEMPDLFPPPKDNRGAYTSEQGMAIFRTILEMTSQ